MKYHDHNVHESSPVEGRKMSDQHVFMHSEYLAVDLGADLQSALGEIFSQVFNHTDISLPP